MTVTAIGTTSVSLVRMATKRRYLMCEPRHFAVTYAINPWMDPSVPVDTDLAVSQWRGLADTYRSLGHEVLEIEPVDGLPDMVFAANGATVAKNRVYGARFRHPERAAEGPAYLSWFRAAGYRTRDAEFVNEGEGDLLVAGTRLLAGTGFRTDPAAHAEAAATLQLPVVSLELVDPRYYHLDTALCVLGDDEIAYFPGAFSQASQETLKALYPDAIIATADDAAVLGLNAVSDGVHVVLPIEAVALAATLRTRGYKPVPVHLSELRKAGGGPKCCTLELRS
ncbi:MAG TPA: amidinotransferase [Acidothermaceae bacterium]|jgi:N-dimethylarginine dimethylaminohydrolase|nr:amidinotransferase [Acidothermaceae bacterium]